MTQSHEPAHPKIARAAHGVAIVRNKLVAGILVAIPLVVTIWVLNLAYRFIKGISDPFLRQVVLVEPNRAQGIAMKTLGDVPAVGFIVTVILLLVLGIMATNMFGKKVLETFENLLLRLPIVATVYAAVKQVIDSVNAYGNVSTFKRVVYIDYPARGAKLLGFVTGQFYDSHLGQDMTSVILPTSPNPMTGLLVIVPTEQVTPSDLTMEEATKLIVSAGLVVPRRAQKPPVPLAVEELSVADRP